MCNPTGLESKGADLPLSNKGFCQIIKTSREWSTVVVLSFDNIANELIAILLNI